MSNEQKAAVARVREFLDARREFLGSATDRMSITSFQRGSRVDPVTLEQEDVETLLEIVLLSDLFAE